MEINQKEQYRILIKKYNICFDGPVCQDGWPASHRKSFDSIRKLGRMELSQYRESISVDSELYPWREQTRRRAERVADLAALCRAGRRNEAGWRLSLESEILVRFTIEVACRKCRARLWRSELEAALSAESHFAESLEERRKTREPCSCKPMRWNEDPHEAGICPLFDDRAEENVLHDQQVLEDLPKKELPDRIYGLRMTKRLERLLLWSEDKRPSSGGKTIGESIKTSPFRADGEPVIFPFLVIEAKSEKGRDSFSDIEAQTAFTIRTLLKIQQDLRDAAGEENESEPSPLVWFFSYKGDQWRVSAAFVQNERGAQSYRIVDLWDGRIVSKEAALQLLLIIDYIFDWARDIYRESIVSELRSLSASDTQSLTNDSDIYSKLDRISFLETAIDRKDKKPEKETSTVTENPPEEKDILDFFCSLDSPSFAFRDATYIRSRFMSLYITEDNMSELTQSMRTAGKAQSAARTTLHCLKESWRVNAEALDQLELIWTGKDRENPNLYSPTKVFLVVVTAAAYLSKSWEQTREISYLAVSADAIEDLVRQANLKIDDNWDFSQLPYVGTDVFVGIGRSLRDISVQDNLLATVSRACVSTGLFSKETIRKKNPEYPPGSVFWVPSVEDVNVGRRYRFDTAVVPDNRAHAREFVSSIYNLHKIGRSEPSSSIFRLSSRLDKQTPNEQTLPTMWPTTDLGDVSQQKSFAITSKNPSNISEYPEFCFFITDPSLMDRGQILNTLAEWSLETRRFDSKPGWGRGWNNTVVKAQDINIEQRITELHDYMQEITELHDHMQEIIKNGLDLCDAQSANGHDSQRIWGPKIAHDSWDMVVAEPTGFLDVLEFVNTLASRGKRVDSVTVRGRGAMGSISDALRFQPDRGRTWGTQDGEPGPSRTPRSADVYEILDDDNDDSQLNGPQDHSNLQPKRARKAGFIDEDSDERGEASSSRKRQRTDRNIPLMRDHLDDDEIEMLLAQGYFD